MAKMMSAAAKAAQGETLWMPLADILSLYNVGIGNLSIGHAGLNGFQKAVGDKVLLQPFSLTDEVRQHITRNKFKLRPFFEEVDHELRLSLAREITGDPEAQKIPDDDLLALAQWNRRYSAALKIKHPVEGLHIFKRDDFFRDNKNPIPNETEIALYPIIEGSPWREQHATATPPKAAKPAEPEGGESAA